MMANNRVSIIVPTYNRGYIIKNVLQSILNQTYTEFELLVVDDASTDQTKEVVCAMEDDRIAYHRMEQNGGPSAARNYGIWKARYDYIAFGDSDDFWHTDKLYRQMEVLTDAGEDIGFCYHKIRYQMGENQYAILPSEKIPAEKKAGNIFAQLLEDNMVACPSLLVRRKCVMEAGGFDTDLKALEDYDLALRIAKKYQAVFIDAVLLESSFSLTGVSGNPVNYLLASCRLVYQYKKEYLATGTLNHRLEIIIRDAETIGMKEHFVKMLERIMVSA